MVFGAYSEPTSTGGEPIASMNLGDGLPKRATAATWLATSGGIGSGTSSAGAPFGTASEVTNPATAAPWENPPSTILVSGQLAAVASMWLAASLMPWMAVGKSVLAGYLTGYTLTDFAPA